MRFGLISMSIQSPWGEGPSSVHPFLFAMSRRGYRGERRRGWGISFPHPFKQAESKGHPEDRGEETKQHRIQYRSHLLVGRLTPSHSDLNHGHNRPGHAFNSKRQGCPGPHSCYAPCLPPEKCGRTRCKDEYPEGSRLLPHHERSDRDDNPSQYRVQLRRPPCHDDEYFFPVKGGKNASVRIDRLEVNAVNAWSDGWETAQVSAGQRAISVWTASKSCCISKGF